MKLKIKTNICEDIVIDVDKCKSLNESISSETKRYIKDEINKHLNSRDLENKINNVIKDALNKKYLEEEIIEIASNCIVQAYKQIWTKRASWSNNLKNKKG